MQITKEEFENIHKYLRMNFLDRNSMDHYDGEVIHNFLNRGKSFFEMSNKLKETEESNALQTNTTKEESC